MKFQQVETIINKFNKDVLEHSENVSFLSYALARKLNLSAEERELAYFGGLLHEAGKFNDIFLKYHLPDDVYPYFSFIEVCVLGNYELAKEVLLHQETKRSKVSQIIGISDYCFHNKNNNDMLILINDKYDQEIIDALLSFDFSELE